MIALLLSAIVCQADFSGAWDRGAWKDVRQLKWDRGTPFVQTEDGLVNWSDESWSDEEIFAKHQIDTCSAMVLTNRFSGPMAFVTRTSFDHRMAPAVVIAADLRKDGKGRDGLGDFFEIVLFDEGLNVWKHTWIGGQERVSKVAYLSARYEPQEPYALTVTVTPKKAQGRPALDIRVSCDGHALGFRDETFPHEYYAGILGAEGRCRFRSFAAATDVAEIALDERPQYLRTIRVNQVGYAAHAPKLAEVPAAFPFKTFAAQKGLDWGLGVNRHEQSFVNGIGRNTQPHEAWGQFYPSTPYIPGAVVHIMDGEYNLPNAGVLLILAQRLDSIHVH